MTKIYNKKIIIRTSCFFQKLVKNNLTFDFFPLLTQKPADIESHVKSWVKLQELILVLGGSLKDIEKRWDEGTGPLAIHFRTEELRSLIKALFQNTQIRANLLAKIK